MYWYRCQNQLLDLTKPAQSSAWQTRQQTLPTDMHDRCWERKEPKPFIHATLSSPWQEQTFYSTGSSSTQSRDSTNLPGTQLQSQQLIQPVAAWFPASQKDHNLTSKFSSVKRTNLVKHLSFSSNLVNCYGANTTPLLSHPLHLLWAHSAFRGVTETQV